MTKHNVSTRRIAADNVPARGAGVSRGFTIGEAATFTFDRPDARPATNPASKRARTTGEDTTRPVIMSELAASDVWQTVFKGLTDEQRRDVFARIAQGITYSALQGLTRRMWAINTGRDADAIRKREAGRGRIVPPTGKTPVSADYYSRDARERSAAMQDREQSHSEDSRIAAADRARRAKLEDAAERRAIAGRNALAARLKRR